MGRIEQKMDISAGEIIARRHATKDYQKSESRELQENSGCNYMLEMIIIDRCAGKEF